MAARFLARDLLVEGSQASQAACGWQARRWRYRRTVIKDAAHFIQRSAGIGIVASWCPLLRPWTPKRRSTWQASVRIWRAHTGAVVCGRLVC